MRKTLVLILSALFVGILFSFLIDQTSAKEYLIIGARPNQLYVIDTSERKIESVIDIPGDGSPSQYAVLSPDSSVVYVVTNRQNSISGIRISDGKEIFRADLSGGGVRERALGIAVHPLRGDIYVYKNRAQLGLNEYKALEPEIAVFSSDAGVIAAAKKSFPAPRRINNMFFSPDGEKLYAFGFDILKLDPDNGVVTGSHPMTNWEHPDYLQPSDFNAPFSALSQTNIYAIPLYTTRADKALDDPAAYETKIAVLNMETDHFEIRDLGVTEEVIFYFAVDPNLEYFYSIFNSIGKIEIETGSTVMKTTPRQSHYLGAVSSDGSELYLGSNGCIIEFLATSDLSELGVLELPGCVDMVFSPPLLVNR